MERLLSVAKVQEATGLGRTTLWRLERDGKFPRRRRIVGHRVGYLASDVEEWVRERPVVQGEDDAEAA